MHFQISWPFSVYSYFFACLGLSFLITQQGLEVKLTQHKTPGQARDIRGLTASDLSSSGFKISTAGTNPPPLLISYAGPAGKPWFLSGGKQHLELTQGRDVVGAQAVRGAQPRCFKSSHVHPLVKHPVDLDFIPVSQSH